MIRLLRIEARHNPTPFVLPLLAALLLITPLATGLVPVGLWLDRSVDVEGSIQLIGPFAAGASAWLAARESRRNMGDLLASTPGNPWTRTVATWLVSLCSMVAFYVLLCTVFLTITAHQATWGSLLWWPSVSGLVALVMCSAAGFAIGQRFTTRFVTPLVAIGTLAVILGVRSATVNDQMAGLGLLSPIYPAFGLDASVYYAPQPDLSMLKIVCFLGVFGIAIGSTALRFRTERPVLLRVGTVLLVAGIALTGTAGGLDATAHSDGHGVMVPAFHDAAADHAVPFTPVCGNSPLPVCVHPAYDGGNELAVLAGIINPIVAPVLGIPGMPVRAEQVPVLAIGGDGQRVMDGVQGNPPILPIPSFIVHGNSMEPAEFQVLFTNSMALSLFIHADSALRAATPVQRALAVYVLDQAHDQVDPRIMGLDPAVTAAATRFAALPSAARAAWLTTYLTAVRADQLNLTDMP